MHIYKYIIVLFLCFVNVIATNTTNNVTHNCATSFSQFMTRYYPYVDFHDDEYNCETLFTQFFSHCVRVPHEYQCNDCFVEEIINVCVEIYTKAFSDDV